MVTSATRVVCGIELDLNSRQFFIRSGTVIPGTTCVTDITTEQALYSNFGAHQEDIGWAWGLDESYGNWSYNFDSQPIVVAPEYATRGKDMGIFSQSCPNGMRKPASTNGMGTRVRFS